MRSSTMSGATGTGEFDATPRKMTRVALNYRTGFTWPCRVSFSPLGITAEPAARLPLLHTLRYAAWRQRQRAWMPWCEAAAGKQERAQRKGNDAMDASRFDQRHYPTLTVQEGYTVWAASYDDETMKELMDRLLARITAVAWEQIEAAADLACGAGRIGSWLTARGGSVSWIGLT